MDPGERAGRLYIYIYIYIYAYTYKELRNWVYQAQAYERTGIRILRWFHSPLKNKKYVYVCIYIERERQRDTVMYYVALYYNVIHCDTSMYVWMDVWMYGCMDVWMYGCMDVWMYGWMDGCMDVCMYVCVQLFVYVYIYIYVPAGDRRAGGPAGGAPSPPRAGGRRR